ncbi:MAG: lipocalin family protein [Thermomonas hydrothermalis]|uniref:lipocalin family protein n=1 Tax=Thermomonas hydrothermalis TaxID=213588 RepID=UPI002355FE8B|nr:lipocalin family protein [Thermomonas hydrothermalis]MCL6618514.1 lipocalin family protein [Thermomonas hydrothermalis]
MSRRLTRWRMLWLTLVFSCAQAAARLPPIPAVAQLDLPRFMGSWYLVGGIPTPFERHAWNAVQTYTLRDDGSILTTLTFHEKRADGPRRHTEAPATVRPGSGNAVWDVRVFGPFKSQYKVVWLRADYGAMLVARDARDYAWLFSRTPQVSAADRAHARQLLADAGYPLEHWRDIPHTARTGSDR